MNWTTDYPTKPGFYWIRNFLRAVDEKWQRFEEVRSDPIVVSVNEDLTFYFPGSETERDASDLLSVEWQGPIEPDAEELISPMCYSSIKIACRECGETDKRSFLSWKVGEADGKPMYGIICRECWIKRLTAEQRKVYMV